MAKQDDWSVCFKVNGTRGRLDWSLTIAFFNITTRIKSDDSYDEKTANNYGRSAYFWEYF